MYIDFMITAPVSVGFKIKPLNVLHEFDRYVNKSTTFNGVNLSEFTRPGLIERLSQYMINIYNTNS